MSYTWMIWKTAYYIICKRNVKTCNYAI